MPSSICYLPAGCHGCDEELWAVGVGTGICHWQKPYIPQKRGKKKEKKKGSALS